MKLEKMIFFKEIEAELLLDNEIMAEAIEPEKLIALGIDFGFSGNLWHAYIAYRIIASRNTYSEFYELNTNTNQSLDSIAHRDFEILKNIFDYDITKLFAGAGILADFKVDEKNLKLDKEITDLFANLVSDLEYAKSVESFKFVIDNFYKTYGIGKYAFYKAFRVDSGFVYELIRPIEMSDTIQFSDIVLYEKQKEKLIQNTEAFLNKRPANNILLFGDAGTGKSSSIKALMHRYFERGLRIIEVYKHEFRLLLEILEEIKDTRYKFIIYMDDLSFEDNELEYKYLKAVLEGGLSKRPDNVLIYATSNRRHLIRESFKDKQESDDELHRRDTVQEKLSLAARFGMHIYYGAPDKQEFNHIVKELAKKNGIEMEENILLQEANRWELLSGGLSGRSASQFITYLKSMAR